MKSFLKFISFVGLGMMAGSAVLVFRGELPRGTYEVLALIGTVLWFAPVPFWMKRRLHSGHAEG